MNRRRPIVVGDADLKRARETIFSAVLLRHPHAERRGLGYHPCRNPKGRALYLSPPTRDARGVMVSADSKLVRVRTYSDTALRAVLEGFGPDLEVSFLPSEAMVVGRWLAKHIECRGREPTPCSDRIRLWAHAAGAASLQWWTDPRPTYLWTPSAQENQDRAAAWRRRAA